MSIKKYFQSRFGDGGLLIEADYSQLEIAVLAHLSNDQQLIYDLKNKVDIHSQNAKALFGSAFTPEQRRLAKQLSFQLQYGAGYASMAKSNNIKKSLAKKFIEKYYERYPEIAHYHDNQYRQAMANRMPGTKQTKDGFPAGTTYIRGETGRRYFLEEEDNPYRPGEPSFSPTKLKNYNVQGTATGDIVPMMLGKLYRTIKAKEEWDDKVLLINTTHDSVTLDCESQYVNEVIDTLYDVLEQAPDFYTKLSGVVFKLPLPIEVKIGHSWEELIKVDKIR